MLNRTYSSFQFFILALSFFFNHLTGYAQLDVIAVDTTTGVPSKTLPFNKPFILKIPAKQKEYPSIYIVDHYGNKTLSETITKRTVKYIVETDSTGNSITKAVSTNYFPTVIHPSYYYTAKEGTKNNLYIRFKDTLTLQPSKLYSLIISADPDDRTLAILDTLHQYSKLTRAGTDTTVRRKKAKLISKAMSIYAAIGDEINDKLAIYWSFVPMRYLSDKQMDTVNIAHLDTSGIVTINNLNQPSEFFKMDTAKIREIVTFHQKTTEPLYRSIDILTINLKQHIATKAIDLLPGPLSPNLALLNELYIRLDTVSTSKLRDQYTQDNNRVLRLINKLQTLDTTEAKLILAGFQPILCSFCKPADSTDYATRLKNIEETADDLQRIRLLSQVLASQNARLPATNIYFQNALASAAKSRGFLKDIGDQVAKIRKSISKNSMFRGADVTNGDTFIFSFETRTKFSLVPEVGLVTNRLFKSGQSSNYLLIPYLGAGINLSQLDRDIPFKLIRNKTPWQRFSFSVGYSLVPLKDDNVNAPRDDFFEKSSLLTGIGFRFSNTIKLMGGYLWYYKRPANTDQSRQLTALPFIGLTFDIDVKKYLETIFSAVTPLRGAAKATETKTE